MLAIDLFCGLGGWTEGLLAEGYDVVGFDIECRPYPAQLVLQDVLTLHGSQFRNAALIVASPPCQAYSYRAMPWKKAKALPPPDNSLFDACFRIQREACEAAGHHIPMVVENVVGAQKWVGKARWHYGSYYLWGDVPALMPITLRGDYYKSPGESWNPSRPSYTKDHSWKVIPDHTKNNGDSWFNVAHNTTSGCGNNPDGRKVPGFRFDGQGSFQSHAVKGAGLGWFNDAKRNGASQTGYLSRSESKSSARKQASALIAKIPFPLAQHIARVYKPAPAKIFVDN